MTKPYRPPTIREVSERIKSWEDFRYHFYNWLDDFYHYPEERERMIRDEIVPTYAEHVTAFLAAAVHHLCLKYGLKPPAWVMNPRYFLKDPWFYPNYISVRPIQFVESPGAFRIRNIFTFRNVLDRV